MRSNETYLITAKCNLDNGEIISVKKKFALGSTPKVPILVADEDFIEIANFNQSNSYEILV